MRAFVGLALAAAVAVAINLAPPPVRGQEKKDDKEKQVTKLLDDIETAMKARKFEEVIALSKKAAELDPMNPAIPYAAGTAHTALRQNEDAVKAYTQVLKLEPKAIVAHDKRGDAHLKIGNFKEAIEDFDAFLKERPKFAPDHWRRGIALYYAQRYKDGVDQFELHRKVNPEDVENSVWHYLCNARANTPKKAREELIPVTRDPRVPMKEILQLYAGKLTPQDVLAAAENAKLGEEDRKEARFYANLYVALWYESEGDAKKCLEHMTAAVEKYKIGHYMWDVGAVHLKLLKAKK